jgi:hypothetical protein
MRRIGFTTEGNPSAEYRGVFQMFLCRQTTCFAKFQEKQHSAKFQKKKYSKKNTYQTKILIKTPKKHLSNKNTWQKTKKNTWKTRDNRLNGRARGNRAST